MGVNTKTQKELYYKLNKQSNHVGNYEFWKKKNLNLENLSKH